MKFVKCDETKLNIFKFKNETPLIPQNRDICTVHRRYR